MITFVSNANHEAMLFMKMLTRSEGNIDTLRFKLAGHEVCSLGREFPVPTADFSEETVCMCLVISYLAPTLSPAGYPLTRSVDRTPFPASERQSPGNPRREIAGMKPEHPFSVVGAPKVRFDLIC